MRRDRLTIPTKPTPAMRRFLVKLAGGPHGLRTPQEMGYPAYPMPWHMERAGWIIALYSRATHIIWGDRPTQIYCRPVAYQITPAGRKILDS
jgi:hypothetical protein